MLSLLLLLFLFISFFIGKRRGFILQIFHLLGFIVAFIVAYVYYAPFAFYIRLWIPYPQFTTDGPFGMLIESFNVEHVYYSGIAFAILFFGAKIVIQIIGSMLDFLAQLPIVRMVNGWVGGLLGFVEMYLILFVLLHVAAILPLEFVQSALHKSTVANFILNYTPVLSGWLKEIWISNFF